MKLDALDEPQTAAAIRAAAAKAGYDSPEAYVVDVVVRAARSNRPAQESGAANGPQPKPLSGEGLEVGLESVRVTTLQRQAVENLQSLFDSIDRQNSKRGRPTLPEHQLDVSRESIYPTSAETRGMEPRIEQAAEH